MVTSESDGRSEQLASTQVTFRAVNANVFDLVRRSGGEMSPLRIVCECASDSCADRIELTPDEYMEVRAKPRTFAVLPSETHVFADIERVVARNGRFWTVEKVGRAGYVAERDGVLRQPHVR